MTSVTNHASGPVVDWNAAFSTSTVLSRTTNAFNQQIVRF